MIKYKALILAAVAASIALSGCSLGRQVTTKRFDFTQNIIPDRNHGAPYVTTPNTGGEPVLVTFQIEITGDVRSKYDRYHGGVDYAFLTYDATSKSNAPIRVRLWTKPARDLSSCPQPADVATTAPVLDVTIPPGGRVTFNKSQGSNVESLRQVVESLLNNPGNSAACVYVQAETTDPAGVITINKLEVEGQAHGSLF